MKKKKSMAKFTDHFFNRLAERNISRKAVQRAIEKGEWIWNSSKKVFVVTGAGLRLILSWDGVVITGYRWQDRLFA